MLKYQKFFNTIFENDSNKNKIIIKNINKNDYCYDCKQKRLYDSVNDYYVCTCCGVVKKNSMNNNISYYELQNNYKNGIYKNLKTNKHKFNRLRKKIKLLGIKDSNIINKIKKYFIKIIDYYEVTEDKKNMMRYFYLIFKILQILRKHEYINYDRLPKKNILIKYDENWYKICKLYGWPFISSI